MSGLTLPAAGLADLGAHIIAATGQAVRAHTVAFGELTLETTPQDMPALAAFLRDDPQCLFQTLIDICGVDYPGRAARFEVVYHFLSMRLNKRVRVRVAVREGASIPSLIPLFPAADWFEREAFDMYGIVFADHPDLRRLLTDYGFSGHPLRKDFPLSGEVEVRYDPEQQRVVYEPVVLQQAFRSFDFLSPWEGAQLLPGDEKAG